MAGGLRWLWTLAVAGMLACSVKADPPPPPVPARAQKKALTARLRFAVIGDYGVDNTDEAGVAALVHGWNPDLIVTTGDNNYPAGAAATIDPNIGRYYRSFISPYHGKYGPGAVSNDFFPSLGNHDWVAAGARPYLDYFTLPGNERYYEFVRGDVHFFALDSDPHEPDGVDRASVQAAWLRRALAASTSRWKVVYFHHAPYSSGSHGPTAYMQWPFRDWGADVVLSGHDHDYERFDKGGVPYIVNGLGGNERYMFTGATPDSVARFNAAPGALLVEADTAGMTLSFYGVGGAGGVLVDRFTLAKPAVALGRSAASPPSAATAVKTAEDPGSPISAPSVKDDGARIQYRATFGAPFAYKHVFIDTDTDPSTGYAVGGIGAEYMIENAALYRHGQGRGWSWTRVASVVAAGGNAGDWSWTVPRAALGEAASAGRRADVVFQGSGGAPAYATAPLRQSSTTARR